ncbi:hypothetical protein H0E84_10595 [Luteimonas sp. SJ-92]|uniref:Uncharacterized protein n=1 Tax=Luteimonas salinisoli TaxID=2752307 RepID=A0A853JC59_9GAMM|nr:hypothetical protein [Luteimonas salinisoli]NZA26833.1 hypothetical protein [Luteimonas salinisoli]
MFWKKPKLTDPHLGELAYSSGSWDTHIETRHGRILASVSGSRRSLDGVSRSQLIAIVGDLDRYHSGAVTAIRMDQFASEWLDGTHGTLELSNIISTNVEGQFSLLFGFSAWPDGTINADFCDWKVKEVWCND